MQNIELYLKNLTGKDEKKAQEAANYLIDSSDIELFKKLVEKSDFLFEFIRNNVCKRIEKAVNRNNYMNVIKLFSVYSAYYDDLFASILVKYANQNLTDDLFLLLEKGSAEEKAYSAKYFYYIPDTVSIELLSKYAFDDNESLAYNAAEALGQMNDDVSFNIALGNLSSDDDFEVLKAVKFFVAYGKNYPLSEIFEAMRKSKIQENIAGQIPYMESLVVLLNSEFYNQVLVTIEFILNGLGEILPLSDIFQFELYEILEELINKNKNDNENASIIAEILLTALSKFSMFTQNQEYIFDEDKDTKQEISSIFELLNIQSDEFWNQQKQFVLIELQKSDNRILSVLPIIVEYNLCEAKEKLKEIIDNSKNEIVICETVNTLKLINCIDCIDFDFILNKITNPNIKAILENIRA